MRFHVPIELPSLLNKRMCWQRGASMKKRQRRATKYCMQGKVVPPLPLVVTITRVGPRKLDDDNLQGACKYVRDQIAQVVGVDDGSDLYTWRYRQRVGREEKYGVDVEIATREDAEPASDSLHPEGL